METKRKNGPLSWVLWILKGILVGFGAILPGISGGTLCVTFGMYRPLIDTLTHPIAGLKKYWAAMLPFVIGVAVGFVGLSGLAAWTLEKDTILVTCAFIGFIIGTFPELWEDAGTQGRSKGSFVAMAVGFVLMVGMLTLLKRNTTVTIAPDLFGFFFCGLLWGLSFIVPGLSSSSLLLFFGLYQPMLAGISTFDFSVLLPLGVGMLLCVVLLSKLVERTYKKHYSIASHALLGIVAATTVMLLPQWSGFNLPLLWNFLAIVIGAAVSYGFTRIGKGEKKEEKSEK